MSPRFLPMIALITLAATGVLYSGLTPKADSAVPQQARSLKDRVWNNEPIRITTATGKGGRSIRIGQSQQADDDWLRDLTVSIKNISDKNILFVELELHFPRPNPAPDVPTTAYSMIFGTPPKLVGESSPVLMPNKQWQASLSAEDYTSLGELLAQTGYSPSIKEVEVITREVLFADKTKWATGRIQSLNDLSRNGQSSASLVGQKKNK